GRATRRRPVSKRGPMISSQTANEVLTAPSGTITLGGVDFIVPTPTPQAMTAMMVECRKRIKARRSAKVLELFREFKDYEFAKQVVLDQDGPDLESFINADPKQSLEHLLAEMDDPGMCRFTAFLILKPGD